MSKKKKNVAKGLGVTTLAAATLLSGLGLAPAAATAATAAPESDIPTVVEGLGRAATGADAGKPPAVPKAAQRAIERAAGNGILIQYVAPGKYYLPYETTRDGETGFTSKVFATAAEAADFARSVHSDKWTIPGTSWGDLGYDGKCVRFGGYVRYQDAKFYFFPWDHPELKGMLASNCGLADKSGTQVGRPWSDSSRFKMQDGRIVSAMTTWFLDPNSIPDGYKLGNIGPSSLAEGHFFHSAVVPTVCRDNAPGTEFVAAPPASQFSAAATYTASDDSFTVSGTTVAGRSSVQYSTDGSSWNELTTSSSSKAFEAVVPRAQTTGRYLWLREGSSGAGTKLTIRKAAITAPSIVDGKFSGSGVESNQTIHVSTTNLASNDITTFTASGTSFSDIDLSGELNGATKVTVWQGDTGVRTEVTPSSSEVAPENNGFDTAGVGFDATVTEGQTVDVPFGLRATGDVSQLTLTDSELAAPAGTEFVTGTTSATAQVKRAGSSTWSSLAAANAAVTVSGNKKSATVSVTDADINLADGDTIRWSIPVKGLTAGTGKQVEFTTTGTTNWGTFDASGASDLTVTAAAAAPTITTGPAEGAAVPTSITYTGTAQTGSRVQVFDGTGKLKWSTTITNGTWSAGPFSADTTKDLDLVFKNKVNGVSTTFASRHLTGTPASVEEPVILTGPADGTDVPNVTAYTGTAEPGSRIIVTDGDGALWWSTTATNGTWSLSRVTDPLKPLELHFANKIGGVTTEFAVRNLRAATVPAVITSGPADGSTTPATGTFTGTASKGSRIVVELSDGTLWFTTSADAETGDWSFSRNMDTARDYTLEFYNEIDGVQTKFATRTLRASAAITSGPADGSTVDPTMSTFSGTGTAGQRVWVYDTANNDALWWDTTIQPDGFWTFTRTLNATKSYHFIFKTGTTAGTATQFAERTLNAAN